MGPRPLEGLRPAPVRRVPELPGGTLTLLFTDIEGSTDLVRRLGDRYGDLLAEQRRILRTSVGEHAGIEIDNQGDACFFAFTRARDAVAAAVAAQRALFGHAWPEGAAVRVRMGLHTGEPAVADEGYVGVDVVRAARLGGAARGGQILISATTRALVERDLPAGVSLADAGSLALKSIDEPEPASELLIDGLPRVAPAPAAGRPDPNRYRELAERARRSIEHGVLAELQDGFADLEDHGSERRRSGVPTWALIVLAVLALLVIVPIVTTVIRP
ncbi:MAG TPA: adenylate/guanylate cyclase domain-containing protein [Candidatus Limnocylindria bacterium]|nr:adenylate/guanylate cyclase domain-containing protein [Candidatus Limnocylindria bacterium]